ncbi:MAG: ABC transporter permease [Nanoarchaeota archaeon]
MRRVYYIWLREIKRFMRSRSRIIASLGMPLFFLIAMGFGLGGFVDIEGVDYLEFLVPGIVTMIILFNAMMSGVSVIWDKQFGFMREILVTPVTRSEIVLGKTLGSTTTSVVKGGLVLLVSLPMGMPLPSIEGLLLALAFMILVGMTFSSLGLCFASVIEDFEAFPLIMNLLVLPLFFLSGALFPIKGEGVPYLLEIIASSNPLAYGVDAIRLGLVGIGEIALWLNFSVIIGCFVVFFSLATYLFGRMQM